MALWQWAACIEFISCAHVCWRVTGTEWGRRLGFELHHRQDEELATAQQEKYFCIKRDFTVKELLLH